jgi:fucose permease
MPRSTGVEEAEDADPTPARFVRVGLSFAGLVLVGLGAGATGVLVPYQLADYRISKVLLGLLFFAFSGGYVLSGLANGALIRWLGTRGQLVLGCSVYLVTAFGIGLHPSFPLLAVGSVAFGFGTGILDAGLNAYVATLPNHTSLLNYLHAFFGVGALLGPLLAGEIVDHRRLPWQDTYLVLGAVSAPLLIGFAVVLPRRVSVPLSSGAALRPALRRPEVWLAATFLVLYVGVEVTVGNWGYSLLTLGQGREGLLASRVVSGYWLGLTVGRFLINAIASRLGVSLQRMMYGCLAGVIAATLLTWWGPNAAVGALGFGLMGFFLGPMFPTTIAVTPRLLPGRLVATAIGLLVGASVIGGAFFPWLAGALAQGLGLRSLLPYLLVLAMLQTVGWWSIARRLRDEVPVPAA